MKKLPLISIMFLLFFSFNTLFSSNKKINHRESLGENHLIAHALGGISGKPYSNSLEAFIENYNINKRILWFPYNILYPLSRPHKRWWTIRFFYK